MKKFTVLLGVLGLCVSSCERHEWHTDPEKEPESGDTIRLFQHDDHKKGGEHKEGEDGKKDH